jgi:ABC-type transport system involved in multi-copper enzyme maturation permease subunit
VIGLFAAELLKLRTIRGTWGYALTAIGLAALVTAGTIGSASAEERFASDFQHRLVLDASGATIILALLLGITLVTNEFRHGTITPTLLVTPQRGRLLAAKLLAGGATGVVLLLLALVVIAAVGIVWLGLLDVPLELGDAARGAGRVLVAAVIAGALGAAYGGLIHAQVAALVGALVWLFVVESLLGGLLGLIDADGVMDYFPGQVIFSIGDPNMGGLSFGAAVLVGLAHVAGATVLAFVRTSRRDIT